MKVYLDHSNITQNMHGASRNYRYILDVSGGHQTLTNSTGIITMVDSSLKNSYPPRSLQPPRVKRSMGKSSILAKITICFGQKMGKGRVFHGVKDPTRTLTNLSRILDLV